MKIEFEISDDVLKKYGDEGLQALVEMYLERLMGNDKQAFGKPQAARAPHYLAYVRQLNCVHCGSYPPNEPHHVGAGGMGMKTDDYRTVPLCTKCHGEIHSVNCHLRETVPKKVVDTLVGYIKIVEAT